MVVDDISDTKWTRTKTVVWNRFNPIVVLETGGTHAIAKKMIQKGFNKLKCALGTSVVHNISFRAIIVLNIALGSTFAQIACLFCFRCYFLLRFENLRICFWSADLIFCIICLISSPNAYLLGKRGIVRDLCAIPDILRFKRMGVVTWEGTYLCLKIYC